MSPDAKKTDPKSCAEPGKVANPSGGAMSPDAGIKPDFKQIVDKWVANPSGGAMSPDKVFEMIKYEDRIDRVANPSGGAMSPDSKQTIRKAKAYVVANPSGGAMSPDSNPRISNNDGELKAQKSGSPNFAKITLQKTSFSHVTHELTH